MKAWPIYSYTENTVCVSLLSNADTNITFTHKMGYIKTTRKQNRSSSNPVSKPYQQTNKPSLNSLHLLVAQNRGASQLSKNTTPGQIPPLKNLSLPHTPVVDRFQEVFAGEVDTNRRKTDNDGELRQVRGVLFEFEHLFGTAWHNQLLRVYLLPTSRSISILY